MLPSVHEKLKFLPSYYSEELFLLNVFEKPLIAGYQEILNWTDIDPTVSKLSMHILNLVEMCFHKVGATLIVLRLFGNSQILPVEHEFIYHSLLQSHFSSE